MEWKDVLGKITELAPVAGSFFGAPGIAIGTAIKVIAKTFGLGDDAKPEDIIKALGDPDAQLKLIAAQNAYELEMIKERLADKQDARKTKVESEKVVGHKDYFLYVLAFFGVAAPTAIVSYIIVSGLPTMTKEVALIVGNLTGIMFAKYSGIFDFFFGASDK